MPTNGTDAGFVTTAPTATPDYNSAIVADNRAHANKDTSPSGSDLVVTEIGWYTYTDTEDTNYEVGIYDDSSDRPGDVVGSLSQTNSKGTGTGWKRSTGLSIPVSSSTAYWIALQIDDTSSNTNLRISTSGGAGREESLFQTTLNDPFTQDTNDDDGVAPIYALLEGEIGGGAAGVSDVHINIGDVWTNATEIYVNIDDAWKSSTEAYVNIGDVWKSIY